MSGATGLQLGSAGSLSHKRSRQKCSHRPRGSGGLRQSPFSLSGRSFVAWHLWLEFRCYQRIWVFFLKRRKKKEQKKIVPVSRGLRGLGWGLPGEAGCGQPAWEALCKLCIYYFLLTIKIKCTRCFCIQYTFNPADLDFSGFKSSGELAGFPTSPPVPLNGAGNPCLALSPPVLPGS